MRFTNYCLRQNSHKYLAASLVATFLLLLCMPAYAQEPIHVVYKNDFNSSVKRTWTGTKKFRLVNKDRVSSIRFKARTNKTRLLTMLLPAKQLLGSKILIRTRLKSENVNAASVSGKGIKVMVHTRLSLIHI